MEIVKDLGLGYCAKIYEICVSALGFLWYNAKIIFPSLLITVTSGLYIMYKEKRMYTRLEWFMHILAGFAVGYIMYPLIPDDRGNVKGSIMLILWSSSIKIRALLKSAGPLIAKSLLNKYTASDKGEEDLPPTNV